jgi:hypothetical protein
LNRSIILALTCAGALLAPATALATTTTDVVEQASTAVSQTTTTVSKNLVRNGKFNRGTRYWTTNRRLSTVKVGTVRRYSGAAHLPLALRYARGGTTTVVTDTGTTVATTKPGATYVARVDLRTDRPTVNANLVVREFNSTTSVNHTVAASLSTKSWKSASLQFTPSLANSSLDFKVTATLSNRQRLFVDNASLVEKVTTTTTTTSPTPTATATATPTATATATATPTATATTTSPTPTATATTTSPTPTATATATPTATATATATATPTATATTTSPTPTATATTTSPTPTATPTLNSLMNGTFDSLTTGQMTGAGFQSQIGGPLYGSSAFDDSTVVADSRGTGKAYRLRLEAGTIRSNPAGNNGIVLVVPLSRQVDNACLSYDIKFDANFDWSMGGKLPGLSGVAPGVSPSLPAGGGNPGDKGWSGRLMWNSNGKILNYNYGPRQVSQYGDGVHWPTYAKRGTWHTVKVCYTMNSVGANGGNADGKLQSWLDGVQQVNITNHVFRERTDVHIGHIMWSVFRGGSTMDWAGGWDSWIDFDNVRITTTD